jgi:hypothetical protein
LLVVCAVGCPHGITEDLKISKDPCAFVESELVATKT